MSNGLVKVGTAAARAMLNLITGFKNAVVKYEPQIVEQMIELGVAIAAGIPKGMLDAAKHIIPGALSSIGSTIKSGFKSIFHINSPSKDTQDIGASLMEGLTLGMTSDKTAIPALTKIANALIKSAKDTFQIHSPSKVFTDIGANMMQGVG